MSSSPVTPEAQRISAAAQGIINAAAQIANDNAALDAKYAALQTSDTALQQSDAALAQKFNLDESTIQQLRAQIAGIAPSPIPPVFGGKIPNILVGIERLSGWVLIHTDHSGPHGTATWTPSTTDDFTDIVITPVPYVTGAPWDNFYLHNDRIGPQPQATMFALYGEFMLPTAADNKACNAIECQIEQCINGTTFDTCAWQFPLGGGHPFSTKYRYFDKIKKWQDSPVPFDPTIMQAGKVVTIQAESTVDHAGGIVHMTALTINGQRSEFDLPVSPGKNQWPGANYVQFSTFQMDPVKNQPYRLRVRNCVAMWL
jgi:hypothetical protein